jgi:hypothetical protein
MTLCWHTCCGSAEILLLKTGFWSPDIPYLPDLAGFDLFLFPRMKFQLRVCCYEYVHEIQEVADHLTCDSKNLAPVVFRSVAETFNLLHELRRGLHSRGRQQLN